MKQYMPTKVYLENNAVSSHGSELAALGTKAMIVTGRSSSRKNGSLFDVTHALEVQGIPFVVFNEIEENPSVETTVKAAEKAIEAGADFFIGIGGGSPMDAAKTISLLACNPAQISNARSFLYQTQEAQHYPVAEVPTTSGTGSEVTPFSILTLHDKNTKKSTAHLVFAELALVDPRYLKTSSYHGMVSTCVDALAHTIESYLHTFATPFSRMYAAEGMRIWGSVKENLTSEENFRAMDDGAFAAFMQASVLAGMAIAHTSTSIPHGLSYAVTYELGVPHGKAVGMFLPGFLQTYGNQSEVSDVLELLGFGSVGEFSDYIHTLLGDVELPAALWEKDIELLLSNPVKLKNYPFPLTRAQLEAYLPASH